MYHYYEYPSVHMVPRHYGIRTERYKLMHFYEFGEEWELYDLKKDPDELSNICNKPRNTGLIEQLKDQLKSDIADTKNTGERFGGAITAALFLKEFVADVPWAHLDIAGPATSSSSSTGA